MVLMMKPRVGLTVLTSSPMIFLTIVVLPALSRPLRLCERHANHVMVQHFMAGAYSIKMRSSLSLSLALRRIESIAAAAAGSEFVKFKNSVQTFQCVNTYYGKRWLR